MSNDPTEDQGRQDRLAAPGLHLARRATAGRARGRTRASKRLPVVPGRWRWENIRVRSGRLPDGSGTGQRRCAMRLNRRTRCEPTTSCCAGCSGISPAGRSPAIARGTANVPRGGAALSRSGA
jgi:hypothetical protein